MKQRTSTRQVKVSKAFQVVDEATRKANQDYRLLSLELDNYNEREMLGMGGADEDNYQESDDEDGGRKKKKAKATPKSKDIRSKWSVRPVKPLERLLLDNGISQESVSPFEVNYYTIAAQPSQVTSKHPFCSVCGYLGNYTCIRCGSRFCSVRCNNSHNETRCMKFSM
eukprot:gene31897-38565_t